MIDNYFRVGRQVFPFDGANITSEAGAFRRAREAAGDDRTISIYRASAQHPQCPIIGENPIAGPAALPEGWAVP